MIDSITTALTRLGIGGTGGGTGGGTASSDSTQVDIDIATEQINSKLSALLDKYGKLDVSQFEDYAKSVAGAKIKSNKIAYGIYVLLQSKKYAEAYKDYMKDVKDVMNTGDVKAMENKLSQYVNQWSGVIDGAIIESFTGVVNELKEVLKMIGKQESASTNPSRIQSVNDAIISPNGIS